MQPQSKFCAICRNRFVAMTFSLCACMMWVAQAHSQTGPSNCGPIANHFGPFDYRTQRDTLRSVENAHFKPEVESLITGVTGSIGADIDYLLHVSPNHHRALIAIVRLAEKMKTPQPQGVPFTVECYFDRAIRFKPDDTVVRVLYAQFLTKGGRKNDALQQLEAGVLYAKDNAFSHYNIGLAYFDLGQFDKALAQAHKAGALGFERTELADRLKGINKWQDPAN